MNLKNPIIFYENPRKSGDKSVHLNTHINKIPVPTLTTATISINTYTYTTYSSNYFKNIGARPKTHLSQTNLKVFPTSTVQMSNLISTQSPQKPKLD
jgi:hypothetical protein